MVTSDVRVQTTVHSLDQGRLGTLIKVAMFGALIVCLSLLYLFVQFRGLSTAGAMDQAQISRRLADGKGFTTDYIRPLALSIIQTIRAFNAIHDYQRTVQPIRGLYLTPVTGDQPLFSGIYAGAYKDWAPLITRPPQVRGFPFTAFVPLPIDGQCIIFSDRPRWNQPRTAVP